MMMTHNYDVVQDVVAIALSTKSSVVARQQHQYYAAAYILVEQ